MLDITLVRVIHTNIVNMNVIVNVLDACKRSTFRSSSENDFLQVFWNAIFSQN